MQVEYINGLGIYRAFYSGYQRLLEKRDYLNKINFYPVPDGDTGTNLASTFSSIADSLKAERSVNKVFGSMAEAVLEGARGNSGIIVAQFISGLKRESEGMDKMHMRDFSRAAEKASRYTYAAVSDPVEGTILTVIKDWAAALNNLSARAADVQELFREALRYAEKSLEKTKTVLEENKRAGVEDAGASGFVAFLSGLNAFIVDGIPPIHLGKSRRLDIQVDKAVHPLENMDSIKHRYCTEALLTGENLDPDKIRGILKDSGDSLIVSSSGNSARVHIHTNTPADVFFKLRGLGRIKKEKVDDMLIQYKAAHETHSPVALVTDSIADLPAEIKDRYSIHMVPQRVLWGEDSYLDRLTISPETFYPYLDGEKNYPTSSLPEEVNIENLFSFLSSNYSSALVLPVGAKLSGTKAAFDRVKDRVQGPGFKISVMDTKLNSAAQGLLVLTAAEALAEGKTLEYTEKLVEEEIKKIKIFVAVSTFKYMIRSGRVSPLKGLIANTLNLKPIVSLDAEGKGTAFGKAFSQKSLQKKVVNLAEKFHKESGIRRYAIVHAAAEHKARAFAEDMEKVLGRPPLYIMEISPVVGLHAGVGAVAVAIQTE